ncbi:MAG: Glu/Leu/Phe/Val dehydrogenase dimerization domain-containing protein [Hyphomicrobiales bacterium]
MEREEFMGLFASADFDGHEVVHAFYDRNTGLKGFVAIHSTKLGPAFGGCRMWSYDSERTALRDALRLSRGMSYKNALADLAYGGGKSVIMDDEDQARSPARFEAFGQVVENLGGHYITAEDVGTSVEDLRIVARMTHYVSGVATKDAKGGVGGDPSPRTAHGVIQGMRATVRFVLARDDFDGLTVAVQGVGHVGYCLCGLLHDRGARCVVCDVNEANARRAQTDFGATITDPDAIMSTKADILAPCALGGALNAQTIPRIRAPIVAGAANNQLADAEDGRRLVERGIVCAPDYVINAGGIIAAAAEYAGSGDDKVVTERIERIYDRTLAILEQARHEQRPPSEVADTIARERLGLDCAGH